MLSIVVRCSRFQVSLWVQCCYALSCSEIVGLCGCATQQRSKGNMFVCLVLFVTAAFPPGRQGRPSRDQRAFRPLHCGAGAFLANQHEGGGLLHTIMYIEMCTTSLAERKEVSWTSKKQWFRRCGLCVWWLKGLFDASLRLDRRVRRALLFCPPRARRLCRRSNEQYNLVMFWLRSVGYVCLRVYEVNAVGACLAKALCC